MKEEVLELARFLGAVPFHTEGNENEEAYQYFSRKIDSRPELLQYDAVCPLFIIVTGFWSSADKKARKQRQDYCQKAANFYESCLRKMLGCEFDVNIAHQSRHMSTAMHWLVAWDRSTQGSLFLDFLEEYGRPWIPDKRDGMGNTVLTLLVARKYLGRRIFDEYEDQSLIEKLLGLGANPFLANSAGFSAVDYAWMKHDVDACHAIQKVCSGNVRPKPSLIAPLSKHLDWELSPNYEKVADEITKVYDAARIAQILPKERWQMDRLYFHPIGFSPPEVRRVLQS